MLDWYFLAGQAVRTGAQRAGTALAEMLTGMWIAVSHQAALRQIRDHLFNSGDEG